MTRRRPLPRWPALTALLLFSMLAAGCAASFVHVRPLDLEQGYARATASILDGRHLSPATQRTLNLVDKRWLRMGFEQRLDALWSSPRVGQADRLFAAAEISLQEALRRERNQAPVTLDYYLLGAAFAEELLSEPDTGGGTDLRMPLAAGFYGLATAKVALALLEQPLPADGWTFRAWRRSFRLLPDAGTQAAGAYFDEFRLAWAYRIEGLRNRYEREGVGAPLIGFRENRRREPIERWYPPEGIARSLTALLRFGPVQDGRQQARLQLRSSSESAPLEFGHQRHALAADFTAPYAYILDRSELRRLGELAVFRSSLIAGRRGVYLMEPYDPARIPVLMVHGLGSSPQNFRELTNDILGAPELRERYQIWHYLYPTGLPLLTSAESLRSDIEALLEALRYDSGQPVQPLVIVGHSMGGLLAKTLAVDSGSRLWDANFLLPFAELNTPPQDRELLTRTFFLKPEPWVGRLVLLGTPHRGSDAADGPGGRLARWLLRAPEPLVELNRLLAENNPEALSPAIRRRMESGAVSSIYSLSPNEPTLRALAQLRIDPRIPFHSIIGISVEQPDGRLSDGVVSVDSAHLEGAQSELRIPVGHNEFDDPHALAEIYRILAAHGTAPDPVRTAGTE